MRISHKFRIILLLFSAFMQINAADLVKTPKVEKEYDFMCGCKHIFYKNQFEPSENHFTGSSQSTIIAYNGHSDKIETNRASFSEMIIPDQIVECFMAGRYSRLTGYFFTEPKKYFKITAEYQLDGSSEWKSMELKNFAGTPFWRKFDFYFDFKDQPTLKKVKIKVQSPIDVAENIADDIIYPLYMDEFKICKYCDGMTSNPLPALKKLEANTGKLVLLSENNYSLSVPTGTSNIKIKPFLDPGFTGSTINVNGSVVSSGSFSPDIYLNSDPDKTTFIYVEVSKSLCESNIYVIEVKKPEGPDATLFNLKTSEGAISPVFYRFQNNYTIMVDNDVSTLKLIPFANDPKATIKVDGQDVETGTESQIINVPTDRIVSVVVTATDGFTKRTYNVKVEHVKHEISFTTSTGIGVEKLTNPIIEVQINPAPKSLQTFTVEYEIDSSSTATIGYDYTLSTSTLTFNQSNIKQRIPLNIINDEIPDGGETVVIRLTNPTGGAILGKNPIFTYTIKDLIIYVKSGGSGNGSTWTNAMGDLQEALAVSIPGNEIWMAGSNAEGGMVYKPGPVGSNRGLCFDVNGGISLIGGFPGNAGDEGSREKQNWLVYKTVLDGDLNGNDGEIWPPDSEKIDDNTYSVIHVINQGLTEKEKVVFNGLIVKNGNANYFNEKSNNSGGGMLIVHSNVEINNCMFKNNHAEFGGAIAVVRSIISVDKSIIEKNRSVSMGGGCSLGATESGLDFLELKFTNNYIIDNICNEGPAGGIYIQSPDELVFENNVIVGNKADLSFAGGVFLNMLDKCNVVKIINCTIARNSSFHLGGSLSADYSECSITPVIIENTIFWHNTATTGPAQVYVEHFYGTPPGIMNYCAMNNGIDSLNFSGISFPGYGNINCIPDFVNDSIDYHIGTNSNCIDKGTEIEAPIKDIDGKGRYDHPGHVNVRSNVDIGAYEYNPLP